MCGISCIVALEERARRTHEQDRQKIQERLCESLEHIRHRGPDSRGVWLSTDGRVGMPALGVHGNATD